MGAMAAGAGAANRAMGAVAADSPRRVPLTSTRVCLAEAAIGCVGAQGDDRIGDGRACDDDHIGADSVGADHVGDDHIIGDDCVGDDHIGSENREDRPYPQ